MSDSLIQPLNPVAEVQRLLGDISRSQIYRLLGRHELDGRKCGDRLMVTGESIRRYIASLPPAVIRTGRRKPAPARTTR